MSKNEKIKFTVYLDDEMLKKTDKAVLASGCKSRNEFVIKAIENYIAELTVTQENPVLANKIAEVISKSRRFRRMRKPKKQFFSNRRSKPSCKHLKVTRYGTTSSTRRS